MNEYFVPTRPGIAAAQRRQSAQSQIDSYRRQLQSTRDYIDTLPDGVSKDTQASLADHREQEFAGYIARQQEIIDECDAVLATADPDENILQEIDYLEGAMREMAKSRKRFVGVMAERIEALRESDPTEALRIAKLVPGDPDGLRDLFVNRVLNGFANTEYMNALEDHRKMWG